MKELDNKSGLYTIIQQLRDHWGVCLDKLNTTNTKLAHTLEISPSHLSSVMCGSTAPSRMLLNKLYYLTKLNLPDRERLIHHLLKLYPNVKLELDYSTEDEYKRELLAKVKLILLYGDERELNHLESTLVVLTDIQTTLNLTSPRGLY